VTTLTARVRGVPADQHQHEQEQHHDRAGVDDDLHEAQERRLLHQVQHAQAEHGEHQEQRRVHGVPGEDHAEPAAERHRAEDPERDGLAGGHFGGGLCENHGAHGVTLPGMVLP